MHHGDYIEIEGYENLAPSRSYLKYVRRSSPKDASFTIGGNVEVIYGKYKPITNERELIEYALAFTNDQTDRSEIRSLLQSRKASIFSSIHGDNQTPDTQLVLDHSVITSTRARQREFLLRVISNRDGSAYAFPVSADECLDGVYPLLESVTTKKGEISLVTHIIIFDPKGFEGYVSFLFLDRRRPFANDLRQCRFDGCGKFFLKEHAPKKPHLINCPEHRSNHDRSSTHNSGAKVRVRIVRATRVLSKKGFSETKARRVVEQFCNTNPQLTAVKDIVKRAQVELKQAVKVK